MSQNSSLFLPQFISKSLMNHTIRLITTITLHRGINSLYYLLSHWSVPSESNLRKKCFIPVYSLGLPSNVYGRKGIVAGIALAVAEMVWGEVMKWAWDRTGPVTRHKWPGADHSSGLRGRRPGNNKMKRTEKLGLEVLHKLCLMPRKSTKKNNIWNGQ